VADKVYGQYCGLAKALDLVGERWTLLIIRELAFGPRRFSDLVEGLPGVSTAVLTERLNRLEDARLIIRRTLPPPAASKVYELTEDGHDLAQAIVPLAAWGVRILAANRRKRTEAFRPAWGLLFLRETFDASSARGVHDVYEFHVDDSVISVIVDDGEMQVIEGHSSRPVDVEIHVDATTFIDVGVGRLRGRDAIRQGKLRLVGSAAALRRYRSIIRPLAMPRPDGSRLDRHGGSIDNRSGGRRSGGATARRQKSCSICST
jgi:DNA-binding HxlR family transcriptional regulator/putative sterol carrier protein